MWEYFLHFGSINTRGEKQFKCSGCARLTDLKSRICQILKTTFKRKIECSVHIFFTLTVRILRTLPIRETQHWRGRSIVWAHFRHFGRQKKRNSVESSYSQFKGSYLCVRSFSAFWRPENINSVDSWKPHISRDPMFLWSNFLYLHSLKSWIFRVAKTVQGEQALLIAFCAFCRPESATLAESWNTNYKGTYAAWAHVVHFGGLKRVFSESWNPQFMGTKATVTPFLDWGGRKIHFLPSRQI